MAATEIGPTGNFGVAADEAGMVISGVDHAYTNEKVMFTDRCGNDIARADFNEKVETTLTANITKLTPFAEKMSADLALANAAPTAHFQTSTAAGRTLIDDIKRGTKEKEFETLEITTTYAPLMGADPV